MQATGLANGATRPTDWQGVDWRAANREVRNLRRRIFRASQAGDWATVRSLQKLMLRSYSNTLVSVRRVTEVNRGRNTPGVVVDVEVHEDRTAGLALVIAPARRGTGVGRRATGLQAMDAGGELVQSGAVIRSQRAPPGRAGRARQWAGRACIDAAPT
jgi:hypothetical protein